MEGLDITSTMLTFFKSLLPPEHSEIHIVRAHRVGQRKREPGAPPRDILVKMQDSREKDLVLRAARDLDVLKCCDYVCDIFQDLSAATLMRRQAFRPITTKLMAEKIRYRWLFPFGIAFEFQDKSFQTSNLGKAAKILGIALDEVSTEGHGGEPGASGTATWLNNKAGWRFQRGQGRRPRRHPEKDLGAH